MKKLILTQLIRVITILILAFCAVTVYREYGFELTVIFILTCIYYDMPNKK